MLPNRWQLLLLFASLALSRGVLGSHVMTEGFGQYLLDTGRLVKRYSGNLESGRSYLLPIEHKPPLLLLLRSLQGDVDLYVSGSGRTPSPDDYELKSENFSLDLVFISEEVKPRVSALIYASPQCSENATYSLELYKHDILLDEYTAIKDELDMLWDPPDAGFAGHGRSHSASGSAASGTAAASDSESAGSFIYNLLVQVGRLILFILEVAVDN